MKIFKRSRWLLFATAFLCGTQLPAQNVFVNPQTGKLIAAKSYDSESGHKNGWSSLWRHDQLPLTLTVADEGTLTNGGELKVHAGNLLAEGISMVLAGGSNEDSYMLVSLPLGYRFTGYSMTLANDRNGKTTGKLDFGSVEKTFYETGSGFDIGNYKAVARNPSGNTTMKAQNETGEYTITRQAENMGNRLYFRLGKKSKALFAVTIKSFEVHFSTGKFTETMPSAGFSGSVSCYESPFYSAKVDIGAVQKTQYGYQYDYNNVKDIMANNLLYQADAVKDGMASDVAPQKHIIARHADNGFWFGLENDTYFVESPMTVTLQDNKTVLPVGYRITGAKITLATKLYVPAAITTVVNGMTYYLNSDLKFTTAFTEWQREGNKLKCGDKYLKVKYALSSGYSLTTGTSGDDFDFSENTIGVKKIGTYYYISNDNNGSASLVKESSNAAKFTTSTAWENNSDYTVTLYGTDKETPIKTLNVSGSDYNPSFEVPGLNNDAVMFKVEGLTDGAKAYAQIQLEMETLNPYVNSMDIVCTGAGQKQVKQTLNTNNFEVRGGEFVFYVPQDWGEKGTFTFENLGSKYADDTYGPFAAGGTSRYNFVQSEYWTGGKGADLYNGYDCNADYATKISTTVAGDVPFRFSNIDELDNQSTSTEVRQLEEYPFSLKAYAEQTKPAKGTFGLFDVALGEQKTAYLFVADEPRYNIAPTTATEHRYYAYYKMDVKLEKGNYSALVDFRKVYDSTCFEGDENKPMYGAEVYTVRKDGERVMGYLEVSDVKAAIEKAVTDKVADAPESLDRILYVDLSALGSVVAKDENGFETLRGAFAPNVLVYLPKGIDAKTDNYASRNQDDARFYACRNVVITDKQPFFAPYGISVNAEQYAEYARKITTSDNGKVRIATVALPFTVGIDADGVHTNDDGTSFSVNVMQRENCISAKVEETPMNYIRDVHFVPYTSSTERTEPNTPYMIKVENAPADNETSFTIKQYGCDIEATNGTGVYVGGSSNGTLDGGNCVFTPKVSYGGVMLPKDGNLFYFGKGMFLNSKGISGDLLYMYPFRSYYEYATKGNASKTFGIVFGENHEMPTSVERVKGNSGNLSVTTSSNSLSVTAGAASVVRICDTGGAVIREFCLASGETHNVTLPAGIYIVNKTKVCVK